MKKIISVLLFIFCVNLPISADEIQDVQCFFNDFINAANNYSTDYFNFYSDNAKIVRVVEKPDGSQKSVDIPLERYKSEAKKTSKFARLRKYKNNYFNVKIFPYGDDYKITALRMPSTSDYKIPAYFIVGKDYNGEWKVKEESMNTKVQKFLQEE